MTKNRYCTKIELVLMSLDCLKKKIQLDQDDIEDLKKETDRYGTKHIMKSPGDWNPDIDDEIRHAQRISRRRRELQRTKTEVFQLERALAYIKKDKHYGVIQLLYFQFKTVTETAEELGICAKTVTTNRNRLLYFLARMVYGLKVEEG